MFDKMMMVLLGPILLTQGKRVQKNTPFLPEPPGDRTGTSGQGPLLRVLVVGDSSAAGVGASHQDEALLGQLVSKLSPQFQVEYSLIAVSGSTTRGTVRRLRNTPAESFDVAVTSLGANDATRFVAVEQFQKEQSQLMDVLKNKFDVKFVVCSGLPPMRLFPALPQPLRWIIGRKSESLDRALEQILSTTPQCHYLKSDFTMKKELMASDGFHPGPEVYRLWGQAMAQNIVGLLPKN